ncbi:hypothetical protein PR048_017963 [Dryococelus australis]|uniref:Uncharacterized protein n=1 Tax=Dryococelus australis TaxID=614101 RepID=A0ABQ9HB31_9NEOP|nr:hypothetical protein PR048_017963 [Dryococelus australis]
MADPKVAAEPQTGWSGCHRTNIIREISSDTPAFPCPCFAAEKMQDNKSAPFYGHRDVGRITPSYEFCGCSRQYAWVAVGWKKCGKRYSPRMQSSTWLIDMLMLDHCELIRSLSQLSPFFILECCQEEGFVTRCEVQTVR